MNRLYYCKQQLGLMCGFDQMKTAFAFSSADWPLQKISSRFCTAICSGLKFIICSIMSSVTLTLAVVTDLDGYSNGIPQHKDNVHHNASPLQEIYHSCCSDFLGELNSATLPGIGWLPAELCTWIGNALIKLPPSSRKGTSWLYSSLSSSTGNLVNSFVCIQHCCQVLCNS